MNTAEIDALINAFEAAVRTVAWTESDGEGAPAEELNAVADAREALVAALAT